MRLAHWRVRHTRYRMTGAVCQSCGQPVFPPRPFCPLCSTGLFEARVHWGALALGLRLELEALEAGKAA